MTMSDLNPTPLPLADLIQIRQSSIRSINVVQDLQNLQVIEQYLMTAQSRSVLNRILERIFDSSPTRAWTLTGPYGTGKSYFSLFLMNLISAAQPGHEQAFQQLLTADPILAEQTGNILGSNSSLGFFAIPVSCSRTTLPECLRGGFKQALIPYLDNPLFKPLFSELDKWDTSTDSHTIIEYINTLNQTFKRSNLHFRGILIILDEMGKLLEYASANSEKTDIILFQELAEEINRSGEFAIILLGILHQAFERYASLLNSAAQREWAKVQGRFEDIAFQEPPSLQMRLVVRALETTQVDRYKSLSPILQETADEAWNIGLHPSLLSKEQFHELCVSAYPFHPTALVALPYIFKRLAQNERSLFAYLASSEPFGFQDFAQKHSPPTFLRLHHLFDYLIANFQARLYASGRARQITETIERLSSSPNLEPLEVEILKTICMINWLSETGAFQATENIVINSIYGEGITFEEIKRRLKRLQDRSLIVFRRFNNTYNIWQGSDVDIDERLEAAYRQQSGNFSLAEAIQHYLYPRPLVARRHSYKTGTLRYFEVRYVDVVTYKTISQEIKPGAAGIVLLALPSSPAEFKDFEAWASSEMFTINPFVLIGIAGGSIHLAELALELRALNWVGEKTPDLRDDPVARRELRARIAGVESLIHTELDANLKLHRLSEAKGCSWYWKGHQLPSNGHNGLSHLLSNLCDDIYPQSILVKNELINRRQLSSQAAGARRNLIEGMLLNSPLPHLGIEGYPPERSMYESLLAKGGIHRGSGGEQLEFCDPPSPDPLNLQPVWDEIRDYVFASPPEPRPIANLFEKLGKPPYGLADGVLPVLLCAFLQAHKEETTLYREGSLLADPSVPDWEVLLRRPEFFSVAGCRVTGTRAAVVVRIARGLGTSPSVMPVVRELVRQLRSLPEYAWKTNLLSGRAVALRRAIEFARSPEQLLFQDIPSALELEPITGGELNAKIMEEFFQRLNQALSELATATPRRREWSRDVFLEACELSQNNEGWDTFIMVSREMNGQINHPNLAPLVKRAAEAEDPAVALDSVLALIANRPLRTWTDYDVERFPMLAQAFGKFYIAERNGYLPSISLTKDEKLRSEKLVKQIKNQLDEYQEYPRIIRAALNELESLYRTDNPSNLPENDK